MAYDDPDPQDPMLLVCVALPSGPEAMREMAEVFADEFARLGHDEAKILEMFRQPFYAGAHGAFLGLGEPAVREIVHESVGVWGRVRPFDRDAPAFLTIEDAMTARIDDDPPEFTTLDPLRPGDRASTGGAGIGERLDGGEGEGR